MKKFCLIIFNLLFTFQIFSLSISEFDIVQNKIPQKITDNFLHKCEYNQKDDYYSDSARIYVTKLGLYILGWSKDGKIAYFEEQNLYPKGPYLYFYIFNTVTDKKEITLEFTDYIYESESYINKYVSNKAKLFDDILKKYKINLLKIKYNEFPVKTSDSNVFIDIDYIKQEEIGFVSQINTYNIQAVKDNKIKTLHTENEKNCNRVIPVGYVKSPYENRIAAIVIHSRYTFEESEMFVSLYGCNLNKGFKPFDYEYRMERRDEFNEKEGRTYYRRWSIISRNGETFELSIPLADFEVKNLGKPDFAVTDDGFSLSFNWGGGNYLWYDKFYFKEINKIPYLYKIKSTCTSDEDNDQEYESESKIKILKKYIPITEISTEKINELLAGAFKED